MVSRNITLYSIMPKLCWKCGEAIGDKYKGDSMCKACRGKTSSERYYTLKGSAEAIVELRDRVDHVVGKTHRYKARQGRKITKLKTRVGELEDKVSDITNMFEQMQVKDSQLKSKLDELQAENKGLKDKLDLVGSCLDKTLVENTRMETNLELAGWRMDEMQSTIDNSVSVTVGIDDHLKIMQAEADKRLRRVARMCALLSHDIHTDAKLRTEDYYRDFVDKNNICLYNKTKTKVFDLDKLTWEDL